MDMIDNIRKNIILKEGILYMDFAASGLAYKPIEEKIQSILLTYANTHSEVGYNAELTTKYYENARKSLYKTLEVDDSFYILPAGTGSTGAIKKFQEIMGIYIPPYTRLRYNINPKKVPLVVVGPFEHHSNEVSFREGLCETIRCPLSKDGIIDLQELENILEKNKDREIIGSFSAASNVTGIKNPIKEIYKIIKKYNGIMCVDAAASSAYMNIDCKYYDAMFLSPHKLIGGPGSSGILVIKKYLCDRIQKPTFAGGGTVKYVSRTTQIYSDRVEDREDAGTPGIIQFIKASLAYELRNEIGLEFIKKREQELKDYFEAKIRDIDNIEMYCNYYPDKIPIYSFNIKGFSPYFIAKELSYKYGIQTRAGCSCAGPYGHDLLGLEDGVQFEEKPGWVRISLHYIHKKEDIDYFINSLKEIINLYK